MSNMCPLGSISKRGVHNRLLHWPTNSAAAWKPTGKPTPSSSKANASCNATSRAPPCNCSTEGKTIMRPESSKKMTSFLQRILGGKKPAHQALSLTGTPAIQAKSAEAPEEQFPGPILSILSAKKFDRIFLFYTPHTRKNAQETEAEALQRYPGCRITLHELPISDPKNYRVLIGLLRGIVQKLALRGGCGGARVMCVFPV